MTSMTWDTATVTKTAPATVGLAMPTGLKTLVQFAAIFLGMTAAQDSQFRGLDLNGNAMWQR